MLSEPVNLHLRNGGTSIFLRICENGAPEVLYWGEDLGVIRPCEETSFIESQVSALVSGIADVPPVFSLIPQQSEGWKGTPGLVGTKNGIAHFPAFHATGVETKNGGTEGSISEVSVMLHDDEANIDLQTELLLTPSGVLKARATIKNTDESNYAVESVLVGLPTPAIETCVIDQNGHHLREHDTNIHDFTIGAHQREVYVSRGHTVSSIHGTCQPSTSWSKGLVHYVHVAWSGNTRTIAEKDTQGFQGMLAGEILFPGEVILKEGEEYSTPWIIGTWGIGLNDASSKIHSYVRSRPSHPKSLRPVTLNAWEAVYFNQSADHLIELAKIASRVGVERFVLDDGWFSGRRDDTSSLGDWYVSEEVWPEGLKQIADVVHQRGMQFGLWFEPEMINLRSEAAQKHPDWVLSPNTHLPQEARNQQVIDLTNPEAYEHVKKQILSVLASTKVDYIKWDFNRDVYEAFSQLHKKPVYHYRTLATYRLMSEVKERFPDIEIESCAGGGGRIDLGIMEFAVRVWGSDCTDPIERKLIEAGTSLLLPPELVGSHVASEVSHQTGRVTSLATRAANAMFYHMGIEMDLTVLDDKSLEELSKWVELHKGVRDLISHGNSIRIDHPDPGYFIHGVIDQRKEYGVLCVTRIKTSAQRPSPNFCINELDDTTSYSLRELLPGGVETTVEEGRDSVPWWNGNLVLSGKALRLLGIRMPDLKPTQSVLLELRAVK